jgi:O-antigen/teichoic acid export membrane protein
VSTGEPEAAEVGGIPPESAGTPGFARLMGDSASYALGAVAGKLAGIAVLPVVARSLDAGEFGQLDLLSTLGSAVTGIGLLGLDTAITRLWPEHDEAGRRHLFGTWLAIAATVAGTVAVVALAFAPQLASFLVDDRSQAGAVRALAIFVVGATANLVVLNLLRNRQRPKAYAIWSSASVVLYVVLLVGLLHWRDDPASVLLAYGASVFAVGGVGLIVFRAGFRARPRATDARALLRLGIPLVPALVALSLGDVLNRAILLHAAGADQVGALSVAVRFGTTLALLDAGFQLAWQPRAFRVHDQPGGRELIATDARRFASVASLVAILVALPAVEAVPLLAGSGYDSAVPAVGWFVVWGLGLVAFTLASLPSTIAKVTRDVGLAGGLGLVVALGLGVLLAPDHGAAGTAAAMAIGQWFAAAVLFGLGRRRGGLGLPIARVATSYAVAVAVALAATLPAGADRVVVRAGLLVAAAIAMTLDGAVPEAAGWIRDRLTGRQR